MMTPLLDSAAVIGVLLIVGLVAPMLTFAPRFMRKFSVSCPTYGIFTRVRVNALGAGISAAYGTPKVHATRCPLRGRNETCDSACLKDTRW